MREILATAAEWQAETGRVVLATVTATSRSAPRQAGATLALHPDGRVIGSVSGGCVEGAVVEIAAEVQRTDVPRVTRFGISDADALAVGLTCGGTIEVLVRVLHRHDVDLGAMHREVNTDQPVALATVTGHADRPDLVGRAISVTAGRTEGRIDGGDLDTAIASAARAALAAGRTGTRRLGGAGQLLGHDVAVLIQAFGSRPRMIVVGAADHAGAVCRVGRFLGFHVTVCDARSLFATTERFPDADRVVTDWPHRLIAAEPLDARSAICVLTHDPKFDVPAVLAALSGPAGYVGVMGSRRTHEDRLERLRAAGATEEQLARLRSPIGLDLGGRTPEETAISIAAELVQVRNGGSGGPLRDLDGPIHAARRARLIT